MNHYDCSTCHKEFEFQYELTNHLIEKHQPLSKFTCSICNVTFTKKGLKNHKYEEHSN